MTTMPPAVAAPAQDVLNPSSPLATGVQGSAVAIPQPTVAVEVEPKVKVKIERDLDALTEEEGMSSCAANSSLSTCMSNAIAGNAPVVSILNFTFVFLAVGGLP